MSPKYDRLVGADSNGNLPPIVASQLKGSQGDKGSPGKSAYEIAVANGFSGTEKSWIESLKGDRGADWSKDQQAKAQGYWIVVSPTEPLSTTYTTSDGVTVPIIWEKPLDIVVPVVPTEPSWSLYDRTYRVPNLVGVYYMSAGQILEPERTYTVPGTSTQTITISALAKTGYRLLSNMEWSKQFIDRSAMSLYATDSGIRSQVMTVVPYDSSISASNVRYGLPLLMDLGESVGGSVRWADSGPGLTPSGDNGTNELRYIRSSPDGFYISANTSLTSSAPSFSGSMRLVNLGTENLSAELDITSFPRNHANSITVTFGTGHNVVLSFVNGADGWKVELSGSPASSIGPYNSGTTTNNPFIGNWKFSLFGRMLTVIDPRGNSFSSDRSGSKSDSFSGTIVITPSLWGKQPDPIIFKNVRIGRWV